jgi:hypothetical protein
MPGNRLNFLGEFRARKLPGLVVHFSEAQQGKVFEKIAKQSSRGGLRGVGAREFLSGIPFYGIFLEEKISEGFIELK